MPAGLLRRGPAHPTGLTRLDQTGSVRTFHSPACTGTVGWVTKVACRSETLSAGAGPGGESVQRRHFPRRRVAIHRRNGKNPRALDSGFRNRRPSKWSDWGPWYEGAENTRSEPQAKQRGIRSGPWHDDEEI